MKYRQLGTSDIRVSEVSLGCWTLGGLNWIEGHATGWANVDPYEIESAIKIGIDGGINHFDNADVYGNGDAERLLASCLQNIGIKSDSFIIASKVGHYKGTAAHAYEKIHIRRQCEQSLINLRREYLDIYYLHHADFGPNDRYLNDAAETMQALQTEGKIRLIGQSAYRSSHFKKSVPIIKPTVLQSWAHAMDTRFVERSSIVGQLLEKNDLSFIAFSPLNQGLLLDKFEPESPPVFELGDHRRNSPKFSKEALAGLAPQLNALKCRFGNSTLDLASVALRFVLNYNRIACVIPGFRNKRQVSCNLTTCDRELNKEDMAFIRDVFSKTNTKAATANKTNG
ncbi:aldo/keto reductase [Candidatus Pelagisphaera phototrophica]|uniref:aldo/keto reductase n=1 Tax=Candidatus Pelagisphaera phototrophica TaxID=2684113 RepID=UPI0019FD817A|nr:aldo/keto reductase [Candidatus Pelagisphaera phototrophica]QXD31302.1 aldo/keto reductase [Candidatus Pelagisphaera phototrophica]